MPAFKVNLEARPADGAAYTSGSHHPSKFQLQPDKGGEGGNDIEELIEGFIPRFTEILESALPSTSADMSTAALSAVLTGRDSRTDHVLEEVSHSSTRQW